MRHDMRNAAGGLMCAPRHRCSRRAAKVRPRGGPQPRDPLLPDPRPRLRRAAHRGLSEDLKIGRQMGYSRSKIVDADNPDRVIAYTEGQGVSIGTPPDGLQKMEDDTIEIVDSPDLPPLWEVFGPRRDDGHWTLPELSDEMASPDAALHIGPQHIVLETAAIDAAASWWAPTSPDRAARDVPGPWQGRPVPCRRRGRCRRPTAGSVCHDCSTTRATATGRSPRAPTRSRIENETGARAAARRGQHVVPLVLRRAVVHHGPRRSARQRATGVPGHGCHADQPGAAGPPGGLPRPGLAAAVACGPDSVVQGASRRTRKARR